MRIFEDEYADWKEKDGKRNMETSVATHPIGSDGKVNRKISYCYSCGTTVKNQRYCHGCGNKLIWPHNDDFLIPTSCEEYLKLTDDQKMQLYEIKKKSQ